MNEQMQKIFGGSIRVNVDYEYDGYIDVRVGTDKATQEQADFIEQAIQEKLASLVRGDKMTAEQFWEILWGGEGFKYSDWETKLHSVVCPITPKRFKEALVRLNATSPPGPFTVKMEGSINEDAASSALQAALYNAELPQDVAAVQEAIRKLRFSTVKDPITGETLTKVELERIRITPVNRLIDAARELAFAAQSRISLEQVPSSIIHELYDAVRALDEYMESIK